MQCDCCESVLHKNKNPGADFFGKGTFLMTQNSTQPRDGEKLAWEKPELTVVATPSDVAGLVGPDDDEDFDGSLS